MYTRFWITSRLPLSFAPIAPTTTDESSRLPSRLSASPLTGSNSSLDLLTSMILSSTSTNTNSAPSPASTMPAGPAQKSSSRLTARPSLDYSTLSSRLLMRNTLMSKSSSAVLIRFVFRHLYSSYLVAAQLTCIARTEKNFHLRRSHAAQDRIRQARTSDEPYGAWSRRRQNVFFRSQL